jgi:WD40 repeat protein
MGSDAAMAPQRTKGRQSRTTIRDLTGVLAQSVVIENLTFYRPSKAERPPHEVDEGEIPPCPYPGLAYFGPQDSAVFFGRDAAIGQLEAAVARRTFTALVGASGTGKSSVVLAGLAPRLHAQGGWRFSHFRIGTELEHNPFLALARALVPLYVASEDDTERLANTKKLASKLQTGELTLRDVLGDCRSSNKGTRILLIADQFEEVFTLVSEVALRHRFVDALVAGFPDQVAGKPPDLCLLLTLRADFYGMALRHRPFADALQGRVENLGPMTREELREAIERPAGAVAFESGLVDTLLDDVTSAPGSLPLLQFALREMWGQLDRRRMTRATYDAIGGVEGALARRAQAIYDTQTRKGEDQRAVMLFRRLFTRLVTLGEGAEDTRRIVGRNELGQDAWALAQDLADQNNRLVVTSASAPDHDTAEVAHEALIRNWPTLIEWVSRDRAFQSWLRQLKPRVDEWHANPEDQGTLLRGGPLAVAEDWLGRRGDELSEEERTYIEASIALREAVRHQEEEALAREHARLAEIATAQARTARIQRIAMGALAGVGLLVLAMLGNVLWQQYDTARREMLAYTSLAAQAMKDEQFDRAMRYALQGYPAPGAMPWAPFSTELEGKLAGAALSTYWLRVLRGHTGPVSTVAFSRDGKRVVTASGDNTARLWDAESGKEIAVLKGHTSLLWSAAFSPDGKRVVTASDDATARLWDVESGSEIAVLKGHTSLLRSAAFSPDGKRVVTASDDYTARLWDAKGLEEPTVLKGHERAVASAAFSPDGKRVVTASADNTARLWNAASGTATAVLEGHTNWVLSAAFSPNGKRVVTASADNTARLWDAATGTEDAVLQGHADAVLSAAFSPDGNRVVTASLDGTARLWDAASGKEIAVLKGHEGTVSSAAFGPDGKRVVTVSDDATARLWDAASGKEIAVLKGHEGTVSSAAFSPDGKRVATASADTAARLWDAEREKAVAVLKGHAKEVYSAAFSPDGKRVVTASPDRTARLWDAASGTEIAVLKGHTSGGVWSAAFSPDGKRVVTASSDRTARLWDAASGTEIAVLKGHTNSVLSAAFSPDGERVVTASGDNTARLWDAESGTEIAVLKGHTKGVQSAAFSSDGKRVVTASWDATARLWDVTWATKVRGDDLRKRVCDEKLVGGAQEFNPTELEDPTLRGVGLTQRNPCLRRGPFSFDYWTRLPGEWWAWARALYNPGARQGTGAG